MITADELTELRADQAAALPGTCDLTRDTHTDNGMGEKPATGTSTTNGLGCRIAPASRDEMGSERTEGGQLTPVGDWLITLPYGTEVRSGDRLVSSGKTFEVTQALSPRSWELAVRVLAIRVG